MSKYFREPNRSQPVLLPIDMKDWLPNTDIVHLIIEAVGLMDLSKFLDFYKIGRSGDAPFHPRVLLSLLIYAYSHGVRSSRAIERLCRRDAGYRYLVGDEVPDHSVIARFRKRHSADMEQIFVEVLRLCHAAGLVRMGVVSLDGTKVKANASLDSNRTAKTIEEEVSAMMAEANNVDAKEDKLYGSHRGDELPKDLTDPNSRKSRLQTCKDKLAAKAAEVAARKQEKIDRRAEEERASGRKKPGRKPKPAQWDIDPASVANVTDPDSEIMKTRRGWTQGYNAQAVVTGDQIILAADLTTQANDVQQLNPMLNQAQAMAEAILGEDAALGTALADAGYWSDANAATETSDCELMIATQKDYKQRKDLADAPPPRGRIPKNASRKDRMNRKLRTKRGRSLYKLRGQTVEPVFGQMKEGQAAHTFSMRGFVACQGEWKLQAAVHNLKKLHRESVKITKNGQKKRAA